MNPDEEVPAAILESLQREYAEKRERGLRVKDFLAAQDADGLVALGDLLRGFLASSSPRVSLARELGYIEALAEVKFDICFCGKNHEKQMDLELEKISTPTVSTEEEYNVKARGDHFYCLSCGYKYVSLEDRMLRSPGDCPGCELKSKFG